MEVFLDATELKWQDAALCSQTDPEIFYPETTGDALYARRVCVTCPVRQQCLNYAMETEDLYGIWGGTTRDDRRRIKKGLGFDIYSKLGKKWMKKHGIERPADVVE